MNSRGRKSSRPSKQGYDKPKVRRGTIRLQHEVARKVRGGHPWIYREALGQRLRKDQPGRIVEVVDWDGDFVGRGIVDGESAIAIRLMTRSEEEFVGAELVRQRVRSAIRLRRDMFDWEQNQCLRLINGESDGLPAIFVDRYGSYIVCQLFTSAMMGFRDALYDALEAELSPVAIYEQRRFRSLAGQGPRQGAELVRGQVAPVEVQVRDGELQFWVDVTAPLSTGLFPDLRLGRMAIQRWAHGRRVLNVFSYTGAISVHAAHGGAKEVVAVDIAAKAHARARRNFLLNGFDGEAAEHIVGDAFKVLARMAERNRQFDMIVIDPPAFASGTRGGKPWSAVRDYSELVCAALRLIPSGGVLAASSTTHKLSRFEFESAIFRGAVRADTGLRIVERCPLPADFPTTPGFLEADYLKCVMAIRD